MYSEFLDHHLNLVKGLTGFLTACSKWVLEVLSYNVYQSNYHTLRIGYSGGISLNPSCLGWGVISFWIAFVFANAGARKHKLKWMLAGIASICILNISRIVLIVLSSHLGWKTITSLDHHQSFNVFSYFCIFIFMYWYIRVQKKYEGIDLKHKQQKNKLSAV
jgi:exosortase/archaeosortase family protein